MNRLFRLSLVAAAFLVALLQPGSAANAQSGEVIRRIVVEGNQRIEPSTV